MILPRQFKVRNLDGFEYVITKTEDQYGEPAFNVAFKDHPTLGTGCIDMTQFTVKHRLRYGMWTMVEDSFDARIAFLEEHIQAVQFHLDNLQDALKVVKQTAA